MNTTHSLKQAAERRDELLAEADRVWRESCLALADAIPPSMHVWAEELGFRRSEAGGIEYWRLPEWLLDLIASVDRIPGFACGNSEKYPEDDLHVYGFADFEALKSGFADLAEAWHGHVSIRIDEGELPWRVTVRYFFAELVPDELIDRVYDEDEDEE